VAKSKPKSKKRSHRTLNSEFRALGRDMRGQITKAGKKQKKPKILIINPEDHRSDFFLKIIHDADQEKRFKADNFGGKYRRAWDAQDELLSTSSVRELMHGVLENKTQMSADQTDVANSIFNRISRVRLSTRFSGYALSSTDRMQHPTASGQGLFAESKETMRRHNALDLERKDRVQTAMRTEMGKAGATIDSVANAGLREAIAFTLNEFTAPITASDVKPHALKGKTASAALLTEQLREREEAKAIFVTLGGKQEAGPVNRGRAWGQRQGKRIRDVSPPRL